MALSSSAWDLMSSSAGTPRTWASARAAHNVNTLNISNTLPTAETVVIESPLSFEMENTSEYTRVCAGRFLCCADLEAYSTRELLADSNQAEVPVEDTWGDSDSEAADGSGGELGSSRRTA